MLIYLQYIARAAVRGGGAHFKHCMTQQISEPPHLECLVRSTSRPDIMASTARDDDETKEYFDSPEELDKKVSQLAEWMRESKHVIVFTVSLSKQQIL